MTRAALDVVLREVVRRNRLRNGIVYLQVTRGVAKRDHPFPDHAEPAIVVTARHGGRPSPANREEGVGVVTVPDIRWARCDIKSISLLPNVLAKQAAREAGGFEAWQVDEEGMVTEGSSTNAWIVDADGNLVTRPLANSILSGITRLVLKQLAEESGVRVIERAFSVEEAKTAREAFITSTTSFVTPVVRIDDRVIANGQPGSTTSATHRALRPASGDRLIKPHEYVNQVLFDAIGGIRRGFAVPVTLEFSQDRHWQIVGSWLTLLALGDDNKTRKGEALNVVNQVSKRPRCLPKSRSQEQAFRHRLPR